MKPSRVRTGFFPLLWACLCLLLPLLLLGTAARLAHAQAPAAPAAPAADPEATVTTRIEPGCLLSVTIQDEPQLSGSYEVDTDGNIHFTLADDAGGNKEEWAVAVKEKTADEACSLITQSVKKFLLVPEVHVVIARLPRLRVEVSGAARRTGLLELPLKAHLSDALVACSYKPNADLANIRILREAQPETKTPPKTIAVNFTASEPGKGEDDPQLEAGDRIILPILPETTATHETKYVRIVGEVNTEVSIPLTPGLTVKDAFDRAGGLKATADRRKIRLVRGGDGRLLELDADQVEANEPTNNLTLTPGDLIIVGMRDQRLHYAIMGEVMAPKTLDWDTKQKVTVLKALYLAGGPTKNADHHKCLLRKGYLLNPTQTRDIPFDLDQVLKGKQPDMELEAGDAVILLPKPHRPGLLQQLLPWVLRFLPL